MQALIENGMIWDAKLDIANSVSFIHLTILLSGKMAVFRQFLPEPKKIQSLYHITTMTSGATTFPLDQPPEGTSHLQGSTRILAIFGE